MKEENKDQLIERAKYILALYKNAVKHCIYANEYGIRFNNIRTILVKKHKYYLSY